MLKNLLIFASSVTLATIILGISVFRLAGIKYVFSQSPSPAPGIVKPISVDYRLPYPGQITPDNVLWPIKALRDKLWLSLTINPSKKADLELLIADKRLADAKLLFEEQNADLAISVLTKAEKYLENAGQDAQIAKKEGMNTQDFLRRYALATLKHREVLDEILAIAPEDAKPFIVKTEDYPKRLYTNARDGLLEAGANVPQNPFE